MSRSIELDLLSAFAASGAKLLAYLLIARMLLAGGAHADDYAIFTLIRSTLGILAYATLGIAPALIRRLAAASSESAQPSARSLYASAQYPALAFGLLASLLLGLYACFFNTLNIIPTALHTWGPLSAFLIGLAILLRLCSDIPGAYLQAHHRITLDNVLLLTGDLLWIPLTFLLIPLTPTPLLAAAIALAIAYATTAILRLASAARIGAAVLAPLSAIDLPTARHLLAFGGMLTLAQLADFFYAPTDIILINRFLDPTALADYSVAIQMDAALLLITTAITAALYPRVARAYAAGDFPALRRYYLRGTLFTCLLLAAGVSFLILFRQPLLHLWLKTDRPGTRLILPLVLLNTLLGGSATLARTILLAAGKTRLLTTSAFAAGLLNVLVSYLLVRYTPLGIYGIILGTTLAILLRGILYLPHHALKLLHPPPTD